jgi:hypothetical protein
MNTRPTPPTPGRYPAIAQRPASQDAQRRESSASSPDSLAQLEAGLIRIVGGRATAALVQRSRQLCSQHGGAGLPLAHTLVQLASTLLGESLAARLMHLGQLDAVDVSADPTISH